jgi:MFS family permease
MQTPRAVRISGWVLLVCGVFLAGLIGYITSLMAPAMMHPGEFAGGTTFNGTAQQAQSIFMLFGAIIVFGLAGILYGLWMIVTGRRNIAMMISVLVLAVALVAATVWTMSVLPG